MVDVVPVRYEHLPVLRHLFAQLTAERTELTYPVVDAEELDRFVLVMSARADGDPNACCLVAELAGKLLGFVSLAIGERPIGKPHRFAFAEYIGVVPAARGKGIARLLALGAVAWCQQRGIEHLEGNATLQTAADWTRRGWREDMRRVSVTVAEVYASTFVPREERPPVGATHAPEPTPKKRAKPSRRKRERMNGATRPELAP